MSFLRSVIADARSASATPFRGDSRGAIDDGMSRGLDWYTDRRDTFVGAGASPSEPVTEADTSNMVKPASFKPSASIDIGLTPVSSLALDQPPVEIQYESKQEDSIHESSGVSVKVIDDKANEHSAELGNAPAMIQDDGPAGFVLAETKPEPGVDRDSFSSATAELDLDFTPHRFSEPGSQTDQFDPGYTINLPADEPSESLKPGSPKKVFTTNELAFSPTDEDKGAPENIESSSASIATVQRTGAVLKSPHRETTISHGQEGIAASNPVRQTKMSNSPPQRSIISTTGHETNHSDNTAEATADDQLSVPVESKPAEISDRPLLVKDRMSAAPAVRPEKVVGSVQVNQVLPRRSNLDSRQSPSAPASQPGEVKIGRVDVFVQAPQSSTATAAPRPAPAFASRHFLRRL